MGHGDLVEESPATKGSRGMKNQSKHNGNAIRESVKRDPSLRWSFAIAGVMVLAGITIALTGRPGRGPDAFPLLPGPVALHDEPVLYPMPTVPDARLDDYDVYLLERARREIESRARASAHRIREGILEVGALHREAIISDLHGMKSQARSVTSAGGYHERVVAILLKHLNEKGQLERLIANELDQFLYDVERYEQWVLMQSGLYAADPEALDRDDSGRAAFLQALIEALFADYAGDVQRANRKTAAIEGTFIGTGVATMFVNPVIAAIELGVSVVALPVIGRLRDVEGRSGIALENGIEELAEGLCFGSGEYPGLYRGMLRVAEGRMLDLERAMTEAKFREARDFHVERTVR